MLRRDMPEVLAIEAASFEFPWLKDKFHRHLEENACIGKVCELGTKPFTAICGFMVYRLLKEERAIYVLNFAVDPKNRRQGYGTEMFKKLIAGLYSTGKRAIIFEVRENLPFAKRFLIKNGCHEIDMPTQKTEETIYMSKTAKECLRAKKVPGISFEPITPQNWCGVMTVCASSVNVWSRKTIVEYLRQPKHFGVAIKKEDKVIGYMLYRICPDGITVKSKERNDKITGLEICADSRPAEIHISNISVIETMRRQGIGSLAICRLTDKFYWGGLLKFPQKFKQALSPKRFSKKILGQQKELPRQNQ